MGGGASERGGAVSNLRVVPIRDNLPALNDISGWLRRVADELDECDTQDVRTLILVHESQDGEIITRCFGDNPDRSKVVGMFTMAGIQAATGDFA